MNGVNGIINVSLSDDFTIVDGSGTRYTGVTGFTFELWNPSNTNVAASIVPTVAELGTGSYRVTFTPNVLGLWKLVVYHATYFPAGKEGTYQVYSADITAINTTLSTLVADVWGYALRSLTTFGTLVSDVATAVWGATTRTLSAFGFDVTLTTAYDPAKTAASQTSVANVLTGLTDIKGTGFVKDTDSLVNLSHGSIELVKQDIRDAMLLAPTAGTPATGSVDKHLDDIALWSEFTKDVEGGGWTITGNQMIFYKADNATELFRVNLTRGGTPTVDAPDKRARV